MKKFLTYMPMKPLPKLTPTTTPLAKVPGVEHHTAAHTPLPWKRHDMEHDAIVGSDRKAIALVMGRSRSPREDAANLDFIVEAVNSYDAHLACVKALKGLLEECEKIDFSNSIEKPDATPWQQKAREALAKLK